MNPPGRARVAICLGDDEDQVRARGTAIAAELSLPVVVGSARHQEQYDLLLVVRPHRLELREAQRRIGGPIFVDFVVGAVAYRRRSAGTHRQPFARAIGLRGGPVTVVDATAGLGRDSFLLACFGCQVTAVERSPVLGALLHDGLTRARATQNEDLKTIIRRITLTVADARELLARLADHARPDVVYLDPMHPPKRKTALAKKEMRICRRLVGDDDDAGELLAAARNAAGRRVVVKRPRHALPLEPNVAVQYLGRAVRYDVYHPRC